MPEIDLAAVKANYDRDGFICLPSFLSEDELKEVYMQLKDVMENNIADMPPQHVIYEDKDKPNTLKQLQDINR